MDDVAQKNLLDTIFLKLQAGNIPEPMEAADPPIQESSDYFDYGYIERRLHTCPYKEDMNGDSDTLCDCDEEQEHLCAMEV